MSLNDMTEVEQKEWDLKLRKFDTEIARLAAETSKLNEESARLRNERQWFPWIVCASICAASVIFTKLFL